MHTRPSSTLSQEADAYSAQLAARCPTRRAIKPAGTTSKLFGLTEGAHLPPLRDNCVGSSSADDDPLVKREEGLPLAGRRPPTLAPPSSGFQRSRRSASLMGWMLSRPARQHRRGRFRMAASARQYWIGPKRGNQISYTLKYHPALLTLEMYRQLIRDNVPTTSVPCLCCHVSSCPTSTSRKKK